MTAISDILKGLNVAKQENLRKYYCGLCISSVFCDNSIEQVDLMLIFFTGTGQFVLPQENLPIT
ncbi:MAG: hypothetical protein VB814_07130 [Pirellulaceae bacterium]|jgi:hypothetical protein